MGTKNRRKMSEQELNGEEVLKLVEKAQAKGTFNIVDFAKGRGYPQDSVTAYLDLESAYELNKINKQINDVQFGKDEDAEALQAKAKELSEKILASKIVFNMRGVNQATIESITEKCNAEFPPKVNAFGQEEADREWLKAWTCGLVAANLVSIENADGEVDERLFTADDVDEFRQHLPKEIWDLIEEKMQQLTLAGAYFKGLTDAGFLPKS